MTFIIPLLPFVATALFAGKKTGKPAAEEHVPVQMLSSASVASFMTQEEATGLSVAEPEPFLSSQLSAAKNAWFFTTSTASVAQCCGRNFFDSSKQICCAGRVSDKRVTKSDCWDVLPFDTETEICCEGSVTEKKKNMEVVTAAAARHLSTRCLKCAVTAPSRGESARSVIMLR